MSQFQLIDAGFVRGACEEASKTIAALGEQSDAIAGVAGAVARALLAGKRLYSMGNGGSAAEAMHLTEELIGKYRNPRRPLPAVCLNADPTALTCIGNDFGYERIFARQVEALAEEGDLVVAFSTSGNSGNIVEGLKAAKVKGAVTIGLLGKTGGAAREYCDLAIFPPSERTERIQEAHLLLVHLILEAVEIGISHADQHPEASGESESDEKSS